MTWIFGSFQVTPCALISCHILICKQEDDGAPGHSGRVTGRWSHDENHAVSFRQRAENRSRAKDTQPIRGVSDELARGCKRWHRLAPGRRYGKKSSYEYISLHPSLTHHRNINPFENKVWEIYLYKEVCSFLHWSS